MLQVVNMRSSDLILVSASSHFFVKPHRKEASERKIERIHKEIKEGDDVDIEDLLFTEHRDYLISKDGNQFKLNHLAGKYLCIYFYPLSSDDTEGHDSVVDTINLIDMYNQLSPKGCFEVVLVATGTHSHSIRKRMRSSPSNLYKKLLSAVPWLAIPLHDQKSREHAEDTMAISSSKYSPTPVLLDPAGKVIKICESWFLMQYGAEAFPFTPETFTCLAYNDKVAKTGFSAPRTLLISNTRDFLISNDGTQVPVYKLEHKTVFLFFYRNSPYCNRLAEKLKLIYRGRNKDFEIVLIHLYFLEYHRELDTLDGLYTHDMVYGNSFSEAFNSMPWLALPYKDTNCRKLWRIFEAPFEPGDTSSPQPVPVLVVIGPQGSYFEEHGSDILDRYGPGAYPFTREKVVEMEIAQLKKLNLYSLLDSERELIGAYGSQVAVSVLLGKPVLLLLGGALSFDSNEYVWALKKRYCMNKGSEYEFEVVYISLCPTEHYYYDCIVGMPWLVHPYDMNLGKKLYSLFFKCRTDLAVVAFEPDGNMLSKEMIQSTTRLMLHKSFPFINKTLKQSVMEDVCGKYYW